MELKFYKQDGNIIYSYDDLDLERVRVGVVDAAKEKHVPEISQEGNKVRVQVGSVIHPMLDNHYITFILLETNKDLLKMELKPGDEPVAEFELQDGEVVIHAYEHCNLHGVWAA